MRLLLVLVGLLVLSTYDASAQSGRGGRGIGGGHVYDSAGKVKRVPQDQSQPATAPKTKKRTTKR